MYFNIYRIGALSITIPRTQYPTRKYAGILVFNRYTDSYFCLGCADQEQNWFLDLLKIKTTQQANLGKSCALHLVYYVSNVVVYFILGVTVEYYSLLTCFKLNRFHTTEWMSNIFVHLSLDFCQVISFGIK